MNSFTLLVVLLVGLACSAEHERTITQSSLVMIPTNELLVGLGRKDRAEVMDIIGSWRHSFVGGGRPRTLYSTENWRIDYQNDHPDRTGKYKGLRWANLQIQMGGKSRDSQERARKLRDDGLPTSVAEVHALVDSQVGAGIFQRAFTVSLDNRVQVWIHMPSDKSSEGTTKSPQKQQEQQKQQEGGRRPDPWWRPQQSPLFGGRRG